MDDEHYASVERESVDKEMEDNNKDWDEYNDEAEELTTNNKNI